MFARKVAVRLKPDALEQFVSLMDGEIVPWLRTQPGFLGLITLAAPDGSEVATISFWDEEHNAQAYNSSGYPKALKILEELLDAKPYVKTFNVVSSTLQEVHFARPVEKENPQPKSLLDDTGPIQEALRAYETRI
jgi:heme-degrading monooxygenase HmoA